jgi:DNA-binding NarL/FixJ family response regulator
MIRIIIADDHAIVRRGLRHIVEDTQDMAIVAEAENGNDLLEKVHGLSCDLVLLDMCMPGLSGGELVRRIKGIKAKLPVLVLSQHSEGQIANRMLKEGAAGYITKDTDPDTLVQAVRKVAGGGKFIDPALVDKIIFDIGLSESQPAHVKLSNREFQIFQMLTDGLSTVEIAEKLVLSKKTISTYRTRLMQKLDVHNLVGLVRYALEHELVS